VFSRKIDENFMAIARKTTFQRQAVLGKSQILCYRIVTINERCLKPDLSLWLREGFTDGSEGA
jgi:hypothetical protein